MKENLLTAVKVRHETRRELRLIAAEHDETMIKTVQRLVDYYRGKGDEQKEKKSNN